MAPLMLTDENIILTVENEASAKRVLDLYLRNRNNFEQFEPTRPFNFYTIEFHETMLKREYRFYTQNSFLRYYISVSDNPKRIIGSVNFNFHRGNREAFAEIGYKVDSLYQRQGIAYKACSLGIAAVNKYYGITRIDARIHPKNAASIRLANKLGFSAVSFEPGSANVMGKTVDIMRYSMRISDTQ